jgi:hypothetical protein
VPEGRNHSEQEAPLRTIFSRRSFGLGAFGATLVGSEAAADDDRRERRQLPWTFAPVPIAGGTAGFGPSGAYHVFGGPGQENSTISNFKGSIGSALISGNVTRTNIQTGVEEYFPFNNANMRFMKGTFKGTDEDEHDGTFAFV